MDKTCMCDGGGSTLHAPSLKCTTYHPEIEKERRLKKREKDMEVRRYMMNLEGVTMCSVHGFNILVGVDTEENRQKVPTYYENMWVFTRIMGPGKLLIGDRNGG